MHKRELGQLFDGGNFAAVVRTARLANVVRTHVLAAVGAFDEVGRIKRMMRTTHVALRFRNLLLRNGHICIPL